LIFQPADAELDPQRLAIELDALNEIGERFADFGAIDVLVLNWWLWRLSHRLPRFFRLQLQQLVRRFRCRARHQRC
jgi:hypothetical protein